MINKKEFLLRKNKGRLELETHLKKLQRAGVNIKDSIFLSLDNSESYLERLKTITDKQSCKTFNRKEGLSNFLFYMDELFNKHHSDQFYLWTKYSEYCGLLKLEDVKSQNIANILDDEYFGGYCSLLSDSMKITFDLDEDYDENNKYIWLYSVSLFII